MLKFIQYNENRSYIKELIKYMRIGSIDIILNLNHKKTK